MQNKYHHNEPKKQGYRYIRIIVDIVNLIPACYNVVSLSPHSLKAPVTSK